jgi:outer membrane protein assembly factor BamB
MVALVAVAAGVRWRARHVGRPAAALQQATGPAASGPEGSALRAPPAGIAGARDARQLHGDARHTGRAGGVAPRAEPRAAWSQDVGGPVEAQVVVSPDGATLYVASLAGSLTALSRADGTVRWKVDLGDRAYATPAVADDGTIYAASDAKKLVALSPEGKTRWTLDMEDEADTGIALAPDGTVVLGAGRRVYGVTPQGFVKWRFAAKRKVFTAPALLPGGGAVFGSQDHHLYALTPQGGPAWSVDLGADVDGAPVVGDDGAVYAGTDGDEVVKLDGADGRVAWRRKVGGFVRGTLSLTRAGEVVAGAYGPAPREVVLAPEDGALRLSFAVQGTGAREFGVHGGGTEDDVGTLVFGAQDDRVRAIDGSGQLLWSFTTGGDVDAPVTLLDDGSLVVASDDGKVYLLRGN